jgi:F-type H+-transporting ATPase subunit b
MAKAKLLAIAVLGLALTLPVVPRALPVCLAQQVQSPETSVQPAPPNEKEAAQKERKETEAGENDSFRHSPSIRWIARVTGLSLDQVYWICFVLNFVVVVVVLWALLRKSVPAIFRARTETIQRRLEEARKTSEDARQRLSAVEARLSRLDVEIEQMRKEAEAAARSEEERVMAAAEEERRRIVASAEQEIALAANVARRELKAYAADLAVSLAEKKIRVSEGEDQRLVHSFVSRLGRDGL